VEQPESSADLTRPYPSIPGAGGLQNENYMYGGEFYYPSEVLVRGTHSAADTYSSAPSWAKESPTSGPTSSYDTWDSACTY